MNNIKLITQFLLFNLIFITTAFSYEQTLNPEFDRPFHHVENCAVCHDITKLTNDQFSPSTGPGHNVRGIRKIIETPNSGFKEVVFEDRNHTDANGVADFADGVGLFNGICEVCHTVNNHHRNDGSDNTTHFDGMRCTACHLHENEFAPPVEQAHRTHLDYRGKGPLIQDCAVCHTPPIETNSSYQFSNDVNYSVVFRDGNTLTTTTVCNNCHSPWGAYPGGDETTALMQPTLGAKANFRTGMYESDGYTLKDGKEKWCVTCHDDRPSTSNYDADPDPALIVPTQIFDYANPAIPEVYYTDGDVAGDGDQTGWIQRSTHARCPDNWGSDYGWMTLNFSVPVDGNYMFSTKWGQDDNSTCNSIDKPGQAVTISITDSNGTTTKTFEQRGVQVDYTEMAAFDIVAGSVELNVSKRNAQCQFSVGAIKIEPQGGSGGGAVVFAPMIAGDDKTWGFYATGHGVSGVQCTECHDPRKKHIDYVQRTFNMDVGWNVVNPWGDSFRLKTKDPINASSICARCHDMELIWDRAGKVAQTNYKNATTGNFNLHAYHNALNTMGRGDADFDGITDSDVSCTNCHNVHGSTKPHMFRDGNLVSSPYTSDKKPMYPQGYEVHVKATWKPVLQGGSYEVFARWPAVAGAATNAPFTVKSLEMFSTTVKVNQSINADTWVSLGTYNFSDNNMSYVILNDKETDGTVIADAIRFLSINEEIIVDNGDNSENGDHNYSTLDINASLSGFIGYNSDYDAIETGTTVAIDTANDNNGHATVDFNKPLLMEQRNILPGAPGVDISSGISVNGVCRSCHTTDDENKDGGNKDIIHFTGPKIINRFEDKRWVMNDGTKDAEVYITARDYDSNISSVTLDLTPIDGGVVAMSPVGQQMYHYTIPGSMINGLADISYKLPVTAVDTDGQSVTDETYIFPKDGKDTIYLDTNGVALYNVHNFRFGVNTAGASWGRIPSDTTYFGPGYRFEVVNLDSGNYGKWTPHIQKSGKYEVYAFWPALAGPTTTAGVDYVAGTVKYTAYAADGTFEVLKDQTVDIGQWNYIGTYNFLDDNSNYIRQESNDLNISMVADAMKFVPVNGEPLLRLSAQQHSKPTRIIDNDGSGLVTVSAIARDYDTGDSPDTFDYDWSSTDQDILDNLSFVTDNEVSWYNSKLTFTPVNFTPGVYTLVCTVTDLGGLTVTNKLQLVVPTTYPTLSALDDTDNDGITDDIEGYSDLDEDGIPNYLDNNSLENKIQDSEGFYLTTEPGLEINVGTTALSVESNDSIITQAELDASGDSGVNALFDNIGDNVGGLFDFDILGLNSIGQSVKVAIHLQGGAVIPTGAVYRKYDSNTSTWSDFVIDADNAIHSAASVAGECPLAGDASYSTALDDSNASVGHDCIQLTIKDGGPNDADDLENAEIKDPGGIYATSTTSNNKKSKGGWGSFGIYSLLILALFGLSSQLLLRKQY